MKPFGRKIAELKIDLPNGLRHFSDGTSFHGFHELYHAKSFMWKFFWFLVCTSACALTAYQVYNAMIQYIQQSTTTLISPSQENDILYPPLSLCFWHWFFWVDWKKALSFNYTRETILYGFSFYNTIYSSISFDVEIAKLNFTKLMKENNFTALSEFYGSIARDVPIFADNKDLKTYFKRIQIVYNDPYQMFCYQVSQEAMWKFFIQNQNDDGSVMQKIITFSTYDESYVNFSNHVTIDEYKHYMSSWADEYSMYRLNRVEDEEMIEDFAKFAPPIILILFSNIEKGTKIQAENDAYQIDVESSIYTWQVKSDKVCKEGSKAVASDDSCRNLCEAHYQRVTCNCQRLEKAFQISNDIPELVCNNGINFLSSKTKKRKTDVPSTNQSCSTNSKFIFDYNKCRNSCLPACQIWNYERTTTVKTSSNILRSVGVKGSTEIRIEYPMGKDIINMIETEAQTWEDFIGNIGGLLGIWTGASILSFIQLFYLCFCADCECCPTASLWLEKFVKGKKPKTNIIHINTIQTNKTSPT